MDYDTKLWDEYTTENQQNPSGKISEFLYYISLGLGAKSICEAGCNVGNNLSGFSSEQKIFGVDLNEFALKKASQKYPNSTFKQANLEKIPFSDNEFDLIFTRGVLIHISRNSLDNVLSELVRVSKKWILNLEYFGNDGEMIKWKRGNDLLWYRNMAENWRKYPVRVVSDIDVPLELDPGKMRLTLVEKMANE